MTPKLFFQFSVNKQSNTIAVRREFLAGIRDVWEAWTIPEILDQWWGSKEWLCKTKSMAFKEGGRRHYVMHGPTGEEFWGITTFEGITLLKSYYGDDCFSDSEGAFNTEYPQSKYSIKFIDRGDRTLIEHETTYPDLKQLEASIEYGFEEGMIKSFEELDNLLL